MTQFHHKFWESPKRTIKDLTLAIKISEIVNKDIFSVGSQPYSEVDRITIMQEKFVDLIITLRQ